jgi:hypothetical protein
MSAPKLLVCFFAAFAFVGCASNQQGDGGLTHALGGIEITDIRQANELRDALPAYLGLPSESIEVKAGSGVTHVTVQTKNNSPTKETIITKLQDLEKNEKLNPIKLLVLPEDDSIFTKATLIQK